MLFLICAADYNHLLKGGIKWFQVRLEFGSI